MPDNPVPVSQQTDGATALSIDQAKNKFVAMGVTYWQTLRGQRRFPARRELTLRGIAPFLPHTVIVEVINEGVDYEYRLVGEEQRQAFRTYFKGIRVSQIEAAAPELGAILRGAYETVRSTGLPFLIQGRVNDEPPNSQFGYHETAFLPLGVNDTAVDHLLIVGVQVPTPFWSVPEEKLKILANQLIAPTAPMHLVGA